FCARLSVCGSALANDEGDVGQRFYVIDTGGLVEKTGLSREGRLVARLATVAFNGVEESRLFAADISAGTAAQLDLEVQVAAENVLAQQPNFFGGFDRVSDALRGQRILAAQIDVAFFRAGGQGGNRHAFENGEWIALHQDAIFEGPWLRLIGIT